jgi:sulfonate transport system substrate-binding protein
MKLRIGVHPNNLHLTLAQIQRPAFGGLEIAYFNYPEGRDTAQFLRSGQFDIGGTGSTPPILAQAVGLDVRYIAASAPRPANGAILVAPNGPIQGLRDLIGQSIGLIDGSFHTYLLAQALEVAGARLADVVRVELSPAAAQAALATGQIAAWIAMAPHLDRVLADGSVRRLTIAGAPIPNRSLFWTLEQRNLPALAVSAFLSGVVRIGQAVTDDPDRAAAQLAAAGIAGQRDPAVWKAAILRRDWTVQLADSTLLAEQRAEADCLYRHGDLTGTILPRRYGDTDGADR